MLTGNELLDFLVFGAGAGVGLQVLASILTGRVPGDGILLAAGGGAILGVMFFIFRGGII